MEPMKGRFNLETLQAFLRDHENRPNSICCHSGENRDSKTFSGMIYIPERGEAWLTRGNPCESEFFRYSV
jgi:isopenicillin-N N-acyltransferase-like protein